MRREKNRMKMDQGEQKIHPKGLNLQKRTEEILSFSLS